MKLELKYIYMSNISMLYYSYIRQKFSLLSSSFGFRISEKRIYRTDIAIAFPCRKRNFIDVDPLPCTLPHLKTFAYSLSFFPAHVSLPINTRELAVIIKDSMIHMRSGCAKGERADEACLLAARGARPFNDTLIIL